MDLDEWGEALPERGFDVFHTPEALAVLDDHAPGELRLYGGFKGQHVVGLLPLFVRETVVGRAALSPPPSMGVAHLGPLLMPNSPKRRKRENANLSFTEAVLDRLDVGSPLTLFRMICTPSYPDPRPYGWADLDVEPSFTYVLDVGSSSPDDLLSSFTRSLRRDIRKEEELGVTIDVEGLDAARQEYEKIASRYAQQDEPPPITWEYTRDLVEALGDRCRVYAARAPDGEFLSAIIALYSNDAASYWAGGTRASYENVSVNSLLHWRIITDIAEDPPLGTVRKYDLLGANTERLCQYKSKFGADLVPYFNVESNGLTMDLAKRAYQLVRG